MRWLSVRGCSSCLLLLLFSTSRAAAQDVGSSAAQGLFEQARTLMRQERFDEACPKLAESLRLEPALGTRLNLGLCHERQGKTATAYLDYMDAQAQAVRESDDVRESLAKQRIAELEPRVIRLVLRADFPRPEGFSVFLDGTRLEAVALGVPLPVDPGEHVVRYEAPGRRPKEARITTSSSSLRPELILTELELVPVAVAAAVPARAAPAPSESKSAHTRTVLTGALFGVGIGTLAFGAYAGLQANASWNDRNEHCSPYCTPEAQAFGESAQRFATMSNLAVGIGLVSVGVGFYLFATRPNEPRKAEVKVMTIARRDRTELAVGGRF